MEPAKNGGQDQDGCETGSIERCVMVSAEDYAENLDDVLYGFLGKEIIHSVLVIMENEGVKEWPVRLRSDHVEVPWPRAKEDLKCLAATLGELFDGSRHMVVTFDTGLNVAIKNVKLLKSKCLIHQDRVDLVDAFFQGKSVDKLRKVMSGAAS